MDGSEVHDSLKDNIDESIAPKEDSEGEEAGIPNPIFEAASIPENDYTKILLLDDEHEIVRVKNDELSAIDQNPLIGNCIEVSNEFQNEEIYRSSRNGKINTGASKDDNYEEAMSKSYTASKDTPPDSKNRNVEYFHQKQNNETEIQLGKNKYMIKEKCQIHTNMTLDEIHEPHDALEEKNNDNCGNMCLEGKSKEKVDDLGV